MKQELIKGEYSFRWNYQIGKPFKWVQYIGDFTGCGCARMAFIYQDGHKARAVEPACMVFTSAVHFATGCGFYLN
jgi:hypothetical protein